MAKKKRATRDDMLAGYWLREKHASKLKDLFPNVTEIRVARTITPDVSWGGEPTKEIDKFKPADKAHFEFPCNQRECVGGFLNLYNTIAKLVKEQGSAVIGNSLCQGWQDEERIGKYHCQFKTDYEIEVKYGK